MSDRPMRLGHRYLLRHTTRNVKAVITSLSFRLDIDTLQHDRSATELHKNDIGEILLTTLEPIVCDPYRINRETGGFILVDECNDTIAAGMIQEAS